MSFAAGRIMVSIMAINEDTKLEELERIKGELRELMPLLSKWRVEELRTLISHFHETKWARRRFAKYGALNKGFTREELDAFLEAVKMHEREINAAQGYLFFKDTRKTRNEKPYLDLNYVRNRFRFYISMLGLNETYASTDETIPTRAERTLHRLTTHSLRHFAITTFNRSVNGNITLTKAFARHRELSSTQVYIHTSKEELYGAIEKAFLADYSNKIESRLYV